MNEMALFNKKELDGLNVNFGMKTYNRDTKINIWAWRSLKKITILQCLQKLKYNGQTNIV